MNKIKQIFSFGSLTMPVKFSQVRCEGRKVRARFWFQFEAQAELYYCCEHTVFKSTHIITLLSKYIILRRGRWTRPMTDPYMGGIYLYFFLAWMILRLIYLKSHHCNLELPFYIPCFPPPTLRLSQSCLFDHFRRLSKEKDRTPTGSSKQLDFTTYCLCLLIYFVWQRF